MPQTRILFGLTAIVAVAGLSLGIVKSSQDDLDAEFLCPNGERVFLAPSGDSVRARTSTGVFTLTPAGASGRYADQFLSVDLAADIVEVNASGEEPPLRCAAVRQHT